MAKKATKKAITKKAIKKNLDPTLVEMSSFAPSTETLSSTQSEPAKRVSPRFITLALIVVGIALLTYKVGPYFVPAMIGYTPVTRFQIWQRLEKSYGAQTLDDLTNEKILDAAIAKSGVKVDQAKVDEQMKSLEKQFESMGGLDAALTQRGMTRAELTKQIKTQLAVETILKDKVTPSDDELKKAFDDGSKTTYKDKKFDDVKTQIKEELTQSKLVTAFKDWFETIKADAKVKSFGL